MMSTRPSLFFTFSSSSCVASSSSSSLTTPRRCSRTRLQGRATFVAHRDDDDDDVGDDDADKNHHNHHRRRAPAQSRRKNLIDVSAATVAMLFVPSRAKAQQTPTESGGEFADAASMAMLQREGEFKLTDAEWQERLKSADDPYAYQVLRKAATERPLGRAWPIWLLPFVDEKIFVCI